MTIYATTLYWGGDVQTGEADIEAEFSVTWNPDAGVEDVKILFVNGKPWPVDMSYGCQTEAQDHEMLVDKLLGDHEEDMIAEAVKEVEQALFDIEKAIDRLKSSATDAPPYTDIILDYADRLREIVSDANI